LRLAHLTDPHLTSLSGVSFRDLRRKEFIGFQSWARRRRRLHLRDRLDVLTTALLTHEPDLICITGDLVHIGLAREHDEALRWLETLGGPERVVIVPGNHDLYTHKSWPTAAARWREWLHLDHPPLHPHDHYPISLNVDAVQVILANSALPMPWFSAQGELGAAQRNALADLLTPSVDPSPRVLLLHHPPERAREAGVPTRKALRDADTAANTLQQADLILHGHTHHNRVRRYGRARVFSTASASAADASFRIFDLTRSALGTWQIDAALFSLSKERMVESGRENWLLTRQG
jgi:3',5'-cyclic AMP phosphodiesterase CpdA